MYQFLAASRAKPTRKSEDDNQDYYLYSTFGKNDGLFYALVVCDGVSACTFGREASRIACDSFISFFDDHINDVINSSEGMITQAIRCAHKEVLNQYPDFNALTTLTAALVIPVKKTLIFANVGDSPAYYFTKNKVKECFTADVKAEPRLLNGKMVIVNGMPLIDHPITALLGFDQIINPNIYHQAYNKGDVIGLCSDGLDDSSIREVLKSPSNIEDIVQQQTFKSKDDCTMIALILDQSGNEYLLAKKLMDYKNLGDSDKNKLLETLNSKSQKFDGLLDKAYQTEANEEFKIKIFTLLPNNLDKKRLIEMADAAAKAKMPKLMNKIISVLRVSH